jgi:SAM-dependent methyltransferase
MTRVSPGAGDRSCPACGAGSATRAFVASDAALRAAPGEFTYRRCRACASVFADPQPDDSVLRSAYASDYGNYNEQRSLVERVAEPLARREAQRVVRQTPSGLPVLEIGCGSGRFLERLRASGWSGELGGVEYAPDVAARAAAVTGIPVAAGTAEDTDLAGRQLGLLALRHVIEHLRDPGAFIARARDSLAPGGRFYLATPDARALSAKAFGRRWWGYEVPRHLVVFSREGLRLLLAAHGFRIVDEWWNFAPQMWNASLFLTLDRGRGTAWAPKATHLLNPLVTVPAVALATVEVATHRSTMYSVLARPV